MGCMHLELLMGVVGVGVGVWWWWGGVEQEVWAGSDGISRGGGKVWSIHAERS